MILNNVNITGSDEPVNIHIDSGKIIAISSASSDVDALDPVRLTFDNAIVFPGLINSHDHLDFNLFPQLGNIIYNNYTEWGKYIHENYKKEIADILKIPALLRMQWGMYKNLLGGVTTVVNHGVNSGMTNDLITVFEQFHYLHSIQFEKNWKIKLNKPFKTKLPVMMHVGEGTDYLSFHEIDQLIRWNLLRKKLIGIHAVAMSENQAKKFEAIIWCPQSNYFLLNKTAPVALLKEHTKILFGTDATLTSTWNIWDHLRLARKTGLLSDQSLYLTLNKNAANTFKINCGEIAAGKDADLVVAKIKNNKSNFDSFFALVPADILLVMHKGNIRLFDEKLLIQLKAVDLKKFSKIYTSGACKYVQGDLPGLIEQIYKYHPAANFPVSCKPMNNDDSQKNKIKTISANQVPGQGC